MLQDLTATKEHLLSGATTPTAEIEKSIATAESDACKHVFLRPMFAQARSRAAEPGLAGLPLGGLSFSLKDLFDVEGQITAAGSRLLANEAPAQTDSPAVARLRAAGGTLIGRTNMVEFAFSGVGINPHFGTPSAWDGRYEIAPGPIPGTDHPVPRVPGGSSSGAAVSVATGAAFIGLGSDTGGSIRIPAALNGIVGFKSTARLVPSAGSVPLSPTLDTVCAMTRSVRDAVLAHEILSGSRVARQPKPLASLRLAVAKTVMLDAMDHTVALAFERGLKRLSQAGVTVVDVALPEIGELAAMQATGGFSAVESYAWHRRLISVGDSVRSQYDPRVLARIERGAQMRAYEYFELVHARRTWMIRMEATLQAYDAVVSPTVPVVAPPIANVAPPAAHDDAFFRVNGLLLRNPSVVNMLDGCALSLPCHVEGELPVGLMLWHGALHDDVLLNLGLQVEAALAR